MNVLLAEANVPYEALKEMDEVNPEFKTSDVVLVVGANDVVNPAAKTTPGSPIYGMPILEVSDAQQVVFLKRSMRPGFAGIENELLYDPQDHAAVRRREGVADQGAGRGQGASDPAGRTRTAVAPGSRPDCAIERPSAARAMNSRHGPGRRPPATPEHVDRGDAGGRAGRPRRGWSRNVEQVVRGQRRVVELVVIARSCPAATCSSRTSPGTGKTTLARAVARSVGGTFQRVQATADLHAGRRHRLLGLGPGRAPVLLRARAGVRRRPPGRRAEPDAAAHAVGVPGGHGGAARSRSTAPGTGCRTPFFVIATQNPLEQYGTYPLPEGQLDRFAIRLHLGGARRRGRAADRPRAARRADRRRTWTPSCPPGGCAASRPRSARTHVAEPVLAARASRSTRATAATTARCGSAPARGRRSRWCAARRRAPCSTAGDYVTPDDVNALAVPVLAHRLVAGRRQQAGPAGGAAGLPSVVRQRTRAADPAVTPS